MSFKPWKILRKKQCNILNIGYEQLFEIMEIYILCKLTSHRTKGERSQMPKFYMEVYFARPLYGKTKQKTQVEAKRPSGRLNPCKNHKIHYALSDLTLTNYEHRSLTIISNEVSNTAIGLFTLKSINSIPMKAFLESGTINHCFRTFIIHSMLCLNWLL